MKLHLSQAGAPEKEAFSRRHILYAALILLTAVLVIEAGKIGLHLILANKQVAPEAQTFPAAPGGLEATPWLEIIPLFESAAPGAEWVSGHGVSYLVRTDSASILLDLGNSGERGAPAPYLVNMQALGIDPAEIDALVISHPHPDHVGGNAAWFGRTLALGGLSGLPVYTPIAMKKAQDTWTHSSQPVLVHPQVGTTGVIPYLETFPMVLFDAKGSEQALVVAVEGQGLVLITGCGHPGLERLVERAELLYGQPVVGVVGGLHYLQSTADELQAQIEFLAKREPGLVALSPHDSGSQAIEAFRAAFPEVYQPVEVGRMIRFQ